MTFYAYSQAGENRFQERFGLDFEDFRPGQKFRHRPGVTLSQQDNLDEALDTMNAAMLHFDANYAAKTMWKRPLMVSTITLQRTVGMSSKTFGRRRSILRFDKIALTKPVFGGDTLYAESEIMDCAPGGDSDVGNVTICALAINGEGVEVARIIYTAEIYRRGCGPDSGARPLAEARFAAWREDEANVFTEQVGIFFEDFRIGETFIHNPRRSFYWNEAVEHSWRSLELNPAFHDLEWIRTNAGGRQRIAETFVITAATAPSTRTFGRVVANLGWSDIELPHPVYAGDTLESESTILDKRDSQSRPNEGILSVETRAFNQDRKLVLSYKRNLLVYRRAAENPYAAAGY